MGRLVVDGQRCRAGAGLAVFTRRADVGTGAAFERRLVVRVQQNARQYHKLFEYLFDVVVVLRRALDQLRSTQN